MPRKPEGGGGRDRRSDRSAAAAPPVRKPSVRGFGAETRSGPKPGAKARKPRAAEVREAPVRVKPPRAPRPEPDAAGDGERIQKWLASAGVASRRAIEDWIREGRITVNGAAATIGQKVGPKDRIAIDGQLQRIADKTEPLRVLLYKKRVGEVVTRADPEGRRTVFRKLPELAGGRWIAVGRLDINTSGLLLLTNDGELARRLMHPSYELQRTYAVRVLGGISDEVVARLKRGVQLEDGPAKFNTIEAVDGRDYDEGEGGAANRWFHVGVREGRNRLVRRLIESQALQVSRLIRIGYGPVQLGSGIKSGSYRELDKDELRTLLAAVDMPPPRAR